MSESNNKVLPLQCMECGAEIPEDECFCSDECFDLWMYGSDEGKAA